jgi:AAHS family 4-hydroxybenzoate transporter-like MFS transporter
MVRQQQKAEPWDEGTWMSRETVDVSALIESRKAGVGQWTLLLLCLLVVTFDGFNAQIMGYVAPALVSGWRVSRTALGPVISAGLFGLMIGALVLGTLGDRIGRKSILVLSTAAFGLFSVATSFATTPGQMLVLRFLTGLGLGGAMPVAIALVAEYAPRSLKNTMATITVCGFAIGPAIGGFVASGLIQQHGWASLFLVGGLVPIVLLPLLWWALPESSRFLIARGAPAGQVAGTLAKVFPGERFSADAVYTHAEANLKKAPVSDVFKGGRGVGTILLWAAIFFNLVGINLQTSWLPLTIAGMGYTAAQAVTATAGFHVGGALGGLALSRLLDKLDFYRALCGVFILAAVMIVLVGQLGGNLTALRLAIFAAGLFVVGGQAALNALSGMFYPSHIRATESGWALGVGRLGAVAGPVVGSSLFALHLSQSTLFYIEAAPFLICAGAVILMKVAGERAATGAAAPGALAEPAVVE